MRKAANSTFIITVLTIVDITVLIRFMDRNSKNIKNIFYELFI